MKTAYLRARISVYRLVAILAAIMLSQIAWPLMQVHAATLNTASMSLQDSTISATSQYTMTATGWSTGQSIGCIEVDLGANSDGTGAIAALDTSASTFVSQTVTGSGTWTVDNTDSATHVLRLTNGTPVVPQSGARTAVWGAVDNGSTAETTYYGVLTTYTDDTCATPSDTVTVTFVYTDSVDVSLTVDPSLSFAVTGTASATACNGVNSNAITTATTVPLGTVTTGTNGIGVQNITVSTNAANGYTAFVRYDNEPTSGSDTIDDHSGTNGSPSTFSAAGVTESFGYTTNDSSLSVTGDGADRFTNPASQFAAFTTSNAEIAYNAGTASSEVTCVAIQAAIEGSTEAGTYTNTVTYTVTPIY